MTVPEPLPLSAVKRGFADCGDRQIHIRRCGPPPGTAAADRTPLVLIHQASGSSRMMVPLMRVLGRDRPVLAPDLPGNGDSDPPAVRQEAMTDFAGSIGQALDALGLASCALYGFHAGAGVAAELAIARPDRVKAVILDSLGLYDPAEAETFVRDYVPAIDRHPHGLHLMATWHYVRDTYLFWPWHKTDADHARAVGLPPLDDLHAKVIEVLKSLDHFGDLYKAAFRHDKPARLPLIQAPTLVAAGRTNSQAHHVPTIASLVPGSEQLLTEGIYTPEAAFATAAALGRWLATTVDGAARMP